MTRKDKLQHLLITEILQAGEVELSLPNGIKLEFGIDKDAGDEQYWLVASQDDRIVSFDPCNLGLQCSRNRLIFNEEDSDSQSLAII